MTLLSIDADTPAAVYDAQPTRRANRVRWRRYTMEFALRGGAMIPEAITELLDPLERLIDGTPATFDFLLEAGDLLIMANRRCLHGRSPLGEPGVHPADSSRLMIRSWIRAS